MTGIFQLHIVHANAEHHSREWMRNQSCSLHDVQGEGRKERGKQGKRGKETGEREIRGRGKI